MLSDEQINGAIQVDAVRRQAAAQSVAAVLAVPALPIARSDEAGERGE